MSLSTHDHVTHARAAAALPVLLPLVQQHAEEAAFLRQSRQTLVRVPHVGLLLLARHDERIEAHLDGLLVAGSAGRRIAQDFARADGSPGAVFAAAVLALRQRDADGLDALLARTVGDDAAWAGLCSAFGWVSAQTLQGVVRDLMASADWRRRALAIEACRMHRIDPGPLLAAALADPRAELRASAVRAAGELGRVDLQAALRSAIADGEPAVVFQAACAACRLGERKASLQVLTAAAQRPGSDGRRHADLALALLVAASPDAAAQQVARDVSAAATAQPTCSHRRRLLRTLALLGDTRHVPWLLQRMHEPEWARAAGEAFGWITGVDLVAQRLETLQEPPHAPDEGPSEDPADEALAADPDDHLPWPDAVRVQALWQRQPQAGPRLFMGRPQDDTAALLHTLRVGTQRQRRHAALLLALARPEQPLLPVAAPAWRQRRWLAPG